MGCRSFFRTVVSSASGPGMLGGLDYSASDSAGGGGSSSDATPAAVTPAAVEGYETGSGSYDLDAWLLQYARIRGGVERLGPVWDVPLRHL